MTNIDTKIPILCR